MGGGCILSTRLEGCRMGWHSGTLPSMLSGFHRLHQANEAHFTALTASSSPVGAR